MLAFIAGIFGSRNTLTSPAKSLADSELARLKPQVQDAFRRWSIKTQQSEQTVRENREPRSMFIPTRNQGQGMVCIELAIKPGGVGGGSSLLLSG